MALNRLKALARPASGRRSRQGRRAVWGSADAEVHPGEGGHSLGSLVAVPLGADGGQRRLGVEFQALPQDLPDLLGVCNANTHTDLRNSVDTSPGGSNVHITSPLED